jgi:phospholipase/carboxylesterase
MLDAVITETSLNSDCAIIWLHGLGADGHDFESIVPELRLPPSLKVRFIFPHAPTMPVTVNGGYVMPAWYDIAGQNILAGEDEEGMRRSQKQIVELIEAEKKKGIPANRIILAGFSQGGAMTLFAGLRYPQKLAGLMVLSAYLPLAEKTTAEMSEANSKTPIFMAHGKQDGVVPFDGARVSKDFLLKRGIPVEWHEYAMAHSLHTQEIKDISAWIEMVLK